MNCWLSSSRPSFKSSLSRPHGPTQTYAQETFAPPAFHKHRVLFQETHLHPHAFCYSNFVARNTRPANVLQLHQTLNSWIPGMPGGGCRLTPADNEKQNVEESTGGGGIRNNHHHRHHHHHQHQRSSPLTNVNVVEPQHHHHHLSCSSSSSSSSSSSCDHDR